MKNKKKILNLQEKLKKLPKNSFFAIKISEAISSIERKELEKRNKHSMALAIEMANRKARVALEAREAFKESMISLGCGLVFFLGAFCYAVGMTTLLFSYIGLVANATYFFINR